MKQINVVMLRGLAGERYSTGLDVLALKLKKIPGIDYVVVAGYTSRHVWANAIESFRDPTVILGHSFGANAAFAMARELNGSVNIPLIVSFDPSRWWSAGTFWGGREIVSDNVRSVRNYYQRQDWPIKGVMAVRNDGGHMGIVNHLTNDEHVDIEDRDDYHLVAIDDIKSVIG
jgi:pimeloyl-ACP methyl ester carboxylesterase